MIDIAEAVCASAAGGSLSSTFGESISLVASAVATAVAEVSGQCSGEGDARLTVQARSRAVARAEAVGVASEAIIAASGVCDACEPALTAFAAAIEAMPVTAVAEASINV